VGIAPTLTTLQVATLLLGHYPKMEEAVGFEPTEPIPGPSCFLDRCNNPLCHASVCDAGIEPASLRWQRST
jgi:hypothetical protein